jgi:type 1 glutamine amidotransferase
MIRKLPFIILLLAIFFANAQEKKTRFKVLAFSENGGHHVEYSKAAKIWLDKLALDSNFTIDYEHDTRKFTDTFLRQYKLLIQLDFVPYNWKSNEMDAFKKYIVKGRGGWIGFHHATLLGDFDGFKMWPWFSEFMGGITYKNYIPGFASGKVNVENSKHPVMIGVPDEFTIEKDEWYTYDKSPRANVKVLASVDEKSYQPKSEVVMGDHPVIWINEKVKARNVYIFMGHSPDLFNNSAYKKIFTNAIFWASKTN